MKRLLVLSVVVLLSFGFTFSGNRNSEKISECPYLDKIHTSVQNNSSECPFISGKEMNQKDESKEACPFLEKKREAKGDCPYLNNKNKKVKEIKPENIKEYKSS